MFAPLTTEMHDESSEQCNGKRRVMTGITLLAESPSEVSIPQHQIFAQKNYHMQCHRNLLPSRFIFARCWLLSACCLCYNHILTEVFGISSRYQEKRWRFKIFGIFQNHDGRNNDDDAHRTMPRCRAIQTTNS